MNGRGGEMSARNSPWVQNLERLLEPIDDGTQVAVPADYSGSAMAAASTES